MDKITETALNIRLHPSNWPSELNPKELPGPFAMHDGMCAAIAAYADFIAVHKSNATSRNLTPAGARAADAAWAETHLPPLRERLVKIRKLAQQLETSLVKELTEEFTELPIEPHEIALLQEIRTWLRSLPETERLTRIRQLAAAGDKSAMRALLTAPRYLVAVDDELLTLIRDEAARHANPRRHAKLLAMRKASLAADRALEGIVRYVEQETSGPLGISSRSTGQSTTSPTTSPPH